MKVVPLLLTAAVISAPHGVAGKSQLSPISRVVELLKGLGDKLEKDIKSAEDLFEDYVCWGKNIISTKTESNEKAQSRVDSLEAYIADLDAGRVELTSERVDLEKEIASLNKEIETATALREKENEDYEAAKDEMEKAEAALEDAIEVLKEATKDSKEGSLMALRGTLGGGFSARVAEATTLEHAVDIGRKFLTDGDSLFLQRILTGEVPEKDWKKLNKKAGFKMSYKARSFKIQGVLNKLLQNFKTSLKDAKDKEEEEKTTFDTLMDTKKEQLQAAEDALGSSSVEGGARGVSKEQAQEEVDDLKTQIKNDEGYIKTAEEDISAKKDEWKIRKELMVGEGAAINKAISILHSDDARDLFKRSHKSQGYSFLQLRSGANAQQQFKDALGMIRSAANSAKDVRLEALSARLSLEGLKGEKGHFDEVIKAIDEMIKTLKDEQSEELDEKEDCEQDRMDDTKEAVDTARAIDELTDEVNRLKAEIAELEAEIEAKEAEVKKIEEELKKATTMREEENAEWVRENEDDTAAAALVGQAKEVLENFYAENKLNLLQHKQPAGEAPPPPPATWEEPYGGAKGESNGIVAILEMIKADIEKDQKKAKADEDEAEKDFQTFKTESEEQISTLEDAITDLEGEVSTKEEKVTSEKEERATKKDEFDATVEKIEDAQPGCDFIRLNFATRTKNRDIEIDGLDKAKAILKGAKFEDDE